MKRLSIRVLKTQLNKKTKAELVEEIAQKHGIETDYKERALEIVNNASEGWGHYDSLNEAYNEVYFI